MQGPGRTSLEPTRLEARGKAQQDKERHGERFASLEASRRLQSPAKATPGLMQQQRVTPGSQRSQRGHHPPSPTAGVPRHRRDAQPSHLDHILFGRATGCWSQGNSSCHLGGPGPEPGIPQDTNPCHRSSGTAPSHPTGNANLGLAWELCALIQGQGFICLFAKCYWSPLRQEQRWRQSLEAMDLYQGQTRGRSLQ